MLRRKANCKRWKRYAFPPFTHTVHATCRVLNPGRTQKCTALTDEVDSIKEAAATDKVAALAAAGKTHESAVSALQSQLQAAQAQMLAAQASASAQSQDSAELAKLRTIAATAEEKVAAQKAACVDLLISFAPITPFV